MANSIQPKAAPSTTDVNEVDPEERVDSPIERVFSMVNDEAPSILSSAAQSASNPPRQAIAERELEPSAIELCCVEKMTKNGVFVRSLSTGETFEIGISELVERELVEEASTAHGLAILARYSGTPQIVGIVQTQRSSVAELRGKRILIEAEDELVLRSGRSAMKLRSDGVLDIIGTRISATSRGLFRLVGRALRLN